MTATATVGSVTERARDRTCWMAAVLVVVVGILVWVSGRPSMGLAVASDARGTAVVTDVTPGALAWAAGVQPDMTVTSVDWSPPSPGFTGSEGHVAATLVDERDDRRVEVTPYTHQDDTASERHRGEVLAYLAGAGISGWQLPLEL